MSGYPIVAPTPAQFARLSALALELQKAEADVAAAEEELKAKKADVELLSRTRIPELMREMRIEEFPLNEGRKLVLKDQVAAKIPDDLMDEAIAWLAKNKEDGMVKRTVTVFFNRDEQSKVDKLTEVLKTAGLRGETEAWIEPQTLKAFARRMVVEEKREDFPHGPFGVFQYDEASIKEPRKRKSVFGE